MANIKTSNSIKAQLADGKCFGKTDATAPRISLPKGGDQSTKIAKLYRQNTVSVKDKK